MFAEVPGSSSALHSCRWASVRKRTRKDCQHDLLHAICSCESLETAHERTSEPCPSIRVSYLQFVAAESCQLRLEDGQKQRPLASSPVEDVNLRFVLLRASLGAAFCRSILPVTAKHRVSRQRACVWQPGHQKARIAVEELLLLLAWVIAALRRAIESFHV